MKIAKSHWALALLLATQAAHPAWAENSAPSPCDYPADQGDAPAESEAGVIPALLPISIRINGALDSKTALAGACFPITLAEPIVVDGTQIVPAGAPGLGQVVHAAKARAGGKGGELILAARFIEYAGVKIPLRSFEFRKAGKDQLDAALAASAAVPMFGYLISGGNVWVADGTVASAKIRQAVRVVPSAAEQGGPDNQGEPVTETEGKTEL